MAGHVLTSGVSYEKRAAELLREDKTQALIDHFEGCIKKGKSSSLKDWKGIFAKQVGGHVTHACMRTTRPRPRAARWRCAGWRRMTFSSNSTSS